MGTAQMFSALAEGHGHLKHKLHNFVALCPIINLGWSEDPLMIYGSDNYDIISDTLFAFDLVEIPSPGHITSGLYEALCDSIDCNKFKEFSESIFGKYSPFNRNDRAIVEDKRNNTVSSAK